MSAFIAGTPVAAKVAAKPVARRDATVRAAANSECVPGAATIGMTRAKHARRRRFRFFATDLF